MVLNDNSFKINFDTFSDVKEQKRKFAFISDWFEYCFKPSIRNFLINYSKARNKSRKDTFLFFSVALQNAIEKEDWQEISFARSKLLDFYREDSMGLLVRSRHQETSEHEKASLYHLNKQIKNGKISNLSKLCKEVLVEKDGALIKERIVLDKREDIEVEVLSYFKTLFQGYHTSNGEVSTEPFSPDFSNLDYFLQGVGQLDPGDSQGLTQPITLEEVQWAIQDSSNNKSPGLDGLTSEFYKATSTYISDELVQVFNDQLNRLKLIDSNKHGVTRLISKVPGIPLVTELRPITLQNLDYKFLTKILAKRLTAVLGKLCKSVQSCSVPGANICTAASNLISTIEGVMRNGGRAALLSLDLYKAYDRVHLGYLERVMGAMKIPKTFIDWILLLHKDADTCFLLDFITNPISILFSVRQGDPIAMVLFLIYIEPLLLRLEDVSAGVVLQARLVRHLSAPLVDGVEEDLEGYVDDTEVFCSDDSDFLAIDECVALFEQVSGAILNRSKKSVVLGFGQWKDRVEWPLKWLKTVKMHKVFGFYLHPDYDVIIEKNWSIQLQKFSSCIKSWSSRSFDSVYERAEILSIFALSKIWFRAQVLPLPQKYAIKFEKEIFNFLWQGQMTKNILSRDTVCLPRERGGLNIPNVQLKCKSLFIKQMFRNICSKNGSKHVDFWLGARLNVPPP